MILANSQIKVSEVAEASNILHDNFEMEKLPARWVLRLLTVDNWIRLFNLNVWPEHLVKVLMCNPWEFLNRVIIVSETWIHYYTSENRDPHA